MNPQQLKSQLKTDLPEPKWLLSPVRIQPSSPSRYPLTPNTAAAQRRVAIAVDPSDESAFAVKWAVLNYLRRGDAVILLHVHPTSVLYGADWGSGDEASHQKLKHEIENFTAAKAADLGKPLVESGIPFKIHVVKDHDLKERLCLEVERLGLSALIMGSRGFGAAKGRLGSVSDYCVQHCVCPVVVVRDPNNGGGGGGKKAVGEAVEHEYHDANDDA